MSHPQVSVILCVYSDERWERLADALASIDAQTVPAYETIVVVDHNGALQERLRRQYPHLHILENSSVRGLSGARNAGIAAARGDILAFLDDDATAAPDWLERLLEPYRDPNVLGVGGAIAPIWAVPRPTWFPEEFDWVVGCTYRGMPEDRRPIRNLIGANMSFRRSVFDAVGEFHSSIGRIGTRPLGCEETEFCIRASQHFPNKFFMYEPRARVSHHVPANRASLRYFLSRCAGEGHSKAVVSRFVGSSVGLSSERTYMLRTLPHGALKGIIDTVRHRRMPGFLRAAAIVAGLSTTILGYLRGSFSLQFAAPVRIETRDL